jgi:hypothetical protein
MQSFLGMARLHVTACDDACKGACCCSAADDDVALSAGLHDKAVPRSRRFTLFDAEHADSEDSYGGESENSRRSSRWSMCSGDDDDDGAEEDGDEKHVAVDSSSGCVRMPSVDAVADDVDGGVFEPPFGGEEDAGELCMDRT